MSEEKGEKLGLCWAHTRPEYQQGQGDCRQSQEQGESLGNEAGWSGDGRVAKGELMDSGQDERADGEGRLKGNRGVQERGRKVRGEVERLAGLLEAGGEQMDLLAGADEMDDRDVLAVAAETVAADRRKRGRPKGAANVRNSRVFDYLEALGHRDPLVTLSLIQTADTRALAQLMEIDKGEALKMQISAAKEMLPYKYAKKPQELNVNERKAHIFLTGTLDVAGGDDDDGTLSIFGGKSTG